MRVYTRAKLSSPKMNNKIILITGATGKQGGAVVRHALERGFAVRALTRHTDRPAAQALKAIGVDVVRGDMDDAASLAQALRGVYGVFCVQNFWEKGVGYAGEARQAHALIQAAQAAHIYHLVYSSIAGCDNARGIEHFESKWATEKLLGAVGVPHTILRTVFFMENFIDRQTGAMMLPVLSGAL